MSSSEIAWSRSLSIILSLIAIGAACFAVYRTNPRSATGEPRADVASAEAAQLESEFNSAGASNISTENDFNIAPASIQLTEAEIPATKEELETEATFVAERLRTALPNEPMAIHVSAMLHAQLHKTEMAEQLWTECIELAPDVEPYYINLAAIALDRGDSELAVKTLEAAQAAGINSPNVTHHLGVALNGLGRSAEAVETVEATLAKEPNSSAHWLILGQAKMQLSENEQAEFALRKAIELGANSKGAYFSLFNVCMRLGKREDAKHFREIYASFDNDDDLSAQERYQVLSESEARKICVSILSEAAALYLAIPDSKSAELLLLRVLALDPKNQSACRELAGIYKSDQAVANEIVMRDRLVKLDSLNLLNYLELAKAHVSAGNSRSAEAAIKLAISLSPQMVTGYAAMADFLLEDGNPEKAQWYVEQAIALKPSSQGYNLLAKTLRAQGREEEANAVEKLQP